MVTPVAVAEDASLAVGDIGSIKRVTSESTYHPLVLAMRRSYASQPAF